MLLYKLQTYTEICVYGTDKSAILLSHCPIMGLNICLLWIVKKAC